MMKIGEQMVWAAAYAASFEAYSSPGEQNQTANAVAAADRALESLKRYEKKMFVTSDSYAMVCEMLGVAPRKDDEE